MGSVVQPSGTVTLVFTDIEGSTRLLAGLGRDAYREALAAHRHVVREAFASHSGFEVDTQGDSFFYAFASATGAVNAVREAMAALEGGPIAVRVGVHTGEPGLDGRNYIGLDVHAAARIMAAGNGGQVLISRATRELLDGALPLRDLGEHRLKDFERPVRLFQLGETVFPPLKTISSTNLPRPVSSFVGREHELAELAALLESGGRIVTLTGPGGSGKTRLAVEAASELLGEFRDGVFWVELAALRDPQLVIPAVSQVLGAPDGVAEHIGERELLLVLDNLEQVIEAAAELAALVEACPRLCLLITSRERLGVQGERELEVPPLPDAEALSLFSTRGRLEPTPAAEQLCRRLDNMPLALELAAARTKALAPEQILARLGGRLDLLSGGRGADPRQHSLRATIEWSYDLLEADEQQLFVRLAVFAGGSTLEAAEQVCDAGLDTLGSLVDKSLVRQSAGRYWMLETIRDYAAERLEESGERETLARRHAAWMLDFAERYDTLLMCVRSDEEADLVDAEHENGRAALDYLLDRDPAIALRLAAALAVVWEGRGRAAEGSALLATAIAAAREANPADIAKAHYRAGTLLASLGNAGSPYEMSLALFEAAGDRIGVALSRAALGVLALVQGELDEAQIFATVALDDARTVGDPMTLWISSCLAAQVLERRGDFRAGRELHLEAIRLTRQAGHQVPIMRALAALGWHELLAADYHRARETLLDQLARLSPRDKPGRLNTVINIGWAELFLGDLASANARFDEGLGLARDLRDKRLAAEAAIATAALLAAKGNTSRASTLWGAGRGLLAECHTHPNPLETRAEARWLEPLRVEYRAEYELGTTLGLDEGIELALRPH